MALTEFILLLLFVGFIAGLFVGLVGVGSTLVLLPTLLLWFPHFLSQDVAIKMTVATTLACTSVSVILAASLHIKQRQVCYHLLLAMVTVYLITAIFGPYLVHFLPARPIIFVVSSVLIITALRILLKKHTKNDKLQTLNRLTFVIVITIAGFANSVCGIGTGNIAIPYLSKYYPHQKAVATSVTSTVFACLLGTVTYIIYGWHAVALPKYSLGYVYLPAFFAAVIGIIVGTPTGYKLSHKLDLRWVRYVLAIVVGFAGVLALLRLF